MKNKLDLVLRDYPLMTLVLAVTFVIVAVVGGVLVLFDAAGKLTFEDYLNDLVKFALAAGILGAGKAVKNGLRDSAAVAVQNDSSGLADAANAGGEYDPETAAVPESPSKRVGDK